MLVTVRMNRPSPVPAVYCTLVQLPFDTDQPVPFTTQLQVVVPSCPVTVAFSVLPLELQAGLEAGGLIVHEGIAITRTVSEQVPMLLQMSVAEQMTVVVPTGYGAFNGWPSLRVHVTGSMPSQLSLAEGVKFTGEPAQTVMFPPPVLQVTTGAVVSTFQNTRRVNDGAELPQMSVAVQVRVWERKQPLTTTGPVVGGCTLIPQLSVMMTVPNALSICPGDGLQCKFIESAPFGLIIGSMVSTVQVTLLVIGIAWLPQLSAAVHVRLRVNVHPEPMVVSVWETVTG